MAEVSRLIENNGIYGQLVPLDLSERRRIADVSFSLSDEGHLLMHGVEMTFGVTGTLEAMSLIQRGSV